MFSDCNQNFTLALMKLKDGGKIIYLSIYIYIYPCLKNCNISRVGRISLNNDRE